MGRASRKKRERRDSQSAAEDSALDELRLHIMRRHEQGLYAQAVDLLLRDGRVKSEDPFGAGMYSKLQGDLRRFGVPDPGRIRPRVHLALRGEQVIGVAGVFPNSSWVNHEIARGSVRVGMGSPPLLHSRATTERGRHLAALPTEPSAFECARSSSCGAGVRQMHSTTT